MKKESLEAMSDTALDGYAKVLGLDVTGKDRAGKLAEIAEARERTADVEVLGRTYTVSIKRLHDRKVMSVLEKQTRITDSEAERIMKAILGKDQYRAFVADCTDEDGTVDSDAWGFGFWQLMRDESLKNF